MERKNTAKTAEKGWGQKNGTEHCKNCDSPISPNDQQASKTISGGCPLYKLCMSFANTLLGFQGAKVAANDNRMSVCRKNKTARPP